MGAMQAKYRMLLVAVLALVVAGCGGNQQTGPANSPQLLATLPAGWTPVTFGRSGFFGSRNASPWLSINIDEDAEPESMLFFTFDNGQVGAVIYDQQTGPTGVVSPTPLPAPNQPVGTFIPYQVEPSYWKRSVFPDTVGFVAPPNTGTNLSVQQVQRWPMSTPGGPYPGPANPTAPEGSPATNEAVIYGGNPVTTITVVWWRNSFNGYGVAQMYAPGGLTPVGSNVTGSGNQAVLRPLEAVTGLFPYSNMLARSNLCRQTLFVRQNAPDPPDVVPPVYQTSVRYTESDNGIVYCIGTPAYPYYPEGVVLAYLRPPIPIATASARQTAQQVVEGRNQYVWSGVSDADRVRMAGLINLGGQPAPGTPDVIVRDLRARDGIPMTKDYRTATGGPLTTNVCADLVSADGLNHRRLLFDLVHQPPGTYNGVQQTDQLFIANITDITNAVLDCSLIIPEP